MGRLASIRVALKVLGIPEPDVLVPLRRRLEDLPDEVELARWKPDLVDVVVVLPDPVHHSPERCRKVIRSLGDVPAVVLALSPRLHTDWLDAGAADTFESSVDQDRFAAILRRRHRRRAPDLDAFPTAVAEAVADTAVSRSELIDMVVHELKNPMTTISANLYCLKKSLSELPLADGHTDEMGRIVEAIAKAGTRLLEVADWFTDAFAGSHSTPIAFDVNREIRATLAMFQGVLGRGVAIDLSLAEDLPTLELDNKGLNQVVLNLLSNAAAAIDGGGSIGVATDLDGDSVVITVTDTGRGIASSDLSRVFESGYTTKARGRGRGLGLTISRAIIEARGGTLSVESEVGTGTRFTLRVPVNDSRVSFSRRDRGPSASPSSPVVARKGHSRQHWV